VQRASEPVWSYLISSLGKLLEIGKIKQQIGITGSVP
jgi:hypothetical protein